jgi:two-component system chemotaxis response regulator CheB
MSVTVLVVDDSSFFRKRVCEILGSVPEIKVVGTASNGREAVDLAKKFRPDVITMDYEMPVMDGVTAVRHIMADCPTSILMFSSLTYEGARVTLDALEAGAVDYLPKNFEDIARDASKMQQVLRTRILALAKARNPGLAVTAMPETRAADTPEPSPARTTPAMPARFSARAPERSERQSESRAPATTPVRRESGSTGKHIAHRVELLVIGCSTGGPVALQKILIGLPANLPVPVLAIQHMPATFTPAFADRLDSLCQVNVKHAEDGDVLKPGRVLIAPGGRQMILSADGSSRCVRILDGDERLTYKPSVDLTFGSAAKVFPGRVLALVLTGMGSDGREGCKLLKRGGSTVWTQSEGTCVIYGMPMAVDKAGLSDQSVNLNDFAPRIVDELC